MKIEEIFFWSQVQISEYFRINFNTTWLLHINNYFLCFSQKEKSYDAGKFNFIEHYKYIMLTICYRPPLVFSWNDRNIFTWSHVLFEDNRKYVRAISVKTEFFKINNNLHIPGLLKIMIFIKKNQKVGFN